VGALLAAARRPQAVRSLVLVEPGATSVALDEPVVAAFEEAMKDARERTRAAGPDEQVRAVFSVIEPDHPLPTPLPPPLADFGRR
jgi:pimeloyl-ACP methyl ester carboxylesterase